MSKRTQKDSGEERVTAKSKPMMNLVSRCSERTPDVLPSTTSQSMGKTRHESQFPLSPQTEQQPRTGRPVVYAYSSSCSEWNVDKTWSSQEWKSDELMEYRTVKPVVSYDMEGHAKKCVERYCELANKTTRQLYKVSTPCIDDHHFKEAELKSVGELSKVCSQIVLKCLHLARIGRPDILWSVNKLARSITKWTKACDKRLSCLVSYSHHTCEYKQCCNVGNTAKQCRLGLF